MEILRVIVGQLDVNCYIVSDEQTKEAVIIDPGDEPEKISDVIEEHGLQPKYIILTHAHYDHVCAIRELRDTYGARLVMHRDDLVTYDYTARLCGVWGYEEEDFPQPDLMPGDGDSITFGSASLSVIHTPGHTPGSICLYGEKVLFTGDTLFRGSAGRTDLPGGNATQLLQSLKALAGLPPLTRVFCGHDEETTLEREKAANPFMLAQQGPDVTA